MEAERDEHQTLARLGKYQAGRKLLAIASPIRVLLPRSRQLGGLSTNSVATERDSGSK